LKSKFPGKKKALSSLLLVSGLHRVARGLQPRSLTVFNFHRIREDGAGRPAPEFDEDVFGPTTSEFRAQLRWLRANAELLSEDDLLAILRGGRRLPARAAMITFDDGYLDNYELALPVLRELGVPAIFFIPTQAIDERALGWWDLIAYVLKKCSRPEITLQGERLPLADRDALKVRLQRWMKLRSAAESRGLVADLARACEVALPDPERCGRELMSWEQVREAAARGVAIGSHTHSHRVLATLDPATQREELRRSKTELEGRLGRPVRTLAYPVGGYEHFNVETQRLARECGYEAAFSFHTGINTSLDPFDIRRLSAPDDVAHYSATFALPGLFAQRRCEASAPGPARSTS
jgi:peptidoglycan/xylan/chitin deacetylase (PgdA/CDA1 family)